MARARTSWIAALGVTVPSVLVAGCSLILDTSNPVMAIDAAPEPDAAPPVDLNEPGFAEIAALPAPISEPMHFEGHPTMTADGLEIYFSSNRSGAGDVYVARRNGVAAAWGAPALVLELSSSSDDAGLFVSPDGLTMWLSSNRPGGRGGYDIYRAERPSRTAGFGTPVLVSEFSSGGNDLSPTVHGWGTDRVEVFLVRAGTGGDLDLFRAVTTPAGAGPAEPVPELNSADGDDCGRISEDGLLLLLCSRRDGVADWNLFVAQRPTLEEPFATPVPLAALNTPGNEREAALLPDNRNVVFARDGELFTALRPEPVPEEVPARHPVR